MSYDLVQAKMCALYLEETLRSWKDFTDAQQAEVARLQVESDDVAKELDHLKLQSELAQNGIYLKSKLSTLEGVRAGIPDLEDEINKTRWSMEVVEFDLNTTSPKGGFQVIRGSLAL